MKVRKNIYLQLIVLVGLIYLVLLMILYCSESSSSNAMIRTFGDAALVFAGDADYRGIW